MQHPSEARAGRKAAPAGEPAHMRWDTSELHIHHCTLATASATRDEVVLNFGTKRPREDHSSEVAVELARRIALAPRTAQHLAATLQRMIDEHDRGSRSSSNQAAGA